MMLKNAIMRSVACCIIITIAACMAGNARADMIPVLSDDRIRVIVSTDISTLTVGRGEPDDTQSMVRFLLYSNEFDVEGLIASDTWARVHPEFIRAIVREYGKVRDNLALHDPRYPTADYLLGLVKGGSTERDSIGEGKDSEASDWIISVVDRPDPRPVWMVFWGGPRELAQALWRVGRDRTPEELARFKNRIRVFAVADQDKTGHWIKSNHPDLFYITGKLTFRGVYRGGDASLVNPEWVDEHITHGHGPLGAAYPNYNGGDPWGRVRGIKEGDTPSFLYLIPTGLSDPLRPELGGWGGRFLRVGTADQFEDAKDTCGSETSEMATVFRWRPEFQADFQARLDWCVKPPSQANHAPVAAIAGDRERIVAPGEVVKLSAAGSKDPDGDKLSFDWSVYREAGAYSGEITIENAGREQAQFTAPNVESPKTVHVILTVTDDGSPRLSRYQRVVVTVDPDKKEK